MTRWTSLPSPCWELDYATLATQYGVTEDQAKEIVRERALIQKLYSQVVPEASTATAPTEPTAPENGDTSTSSAEYAQYIIDLAGDGAGFREQHMGVYGRLLLSGARRCLYRRYRYL